MNSKNKIIRSRRKKTATERIMAIFGRIGTLNIVLICVFGYMIYINYTMIGMFNATGAAPETAWCALIAALLGECGICGWIKTSKEKNKGKSNEESEG